MIALAATLGGCFSSGRQARTTPEPEGWSPLPCATCGRVRLAVDVRRSVTDAGRRGTHLVARVRNLNGHAVAFVARFQADVTPESDGYVPGDELRFILGPTLSATAESLVLLRRTDIALVSIARLERVADVDADARVSSR